MNTAIAVFQHTNFWEVQWIDAKGDPKRRIDFETFENASRFVEGELL